MITKGNSSSDTEDPCSPLKQFKTNSATMDTNTYQHSEGLTYDKVDQEYFHPKGAKKKTTTGEPETIDTSSSNEDSPHTSTPQSMIKMKTIWTNLGTIEHGNNVAHILNQTSTNKPPTGPKPIECTNNLLELRPDSKMDTLSRHSSSFHSHDTYTASQLSHNPNNTPTRTRKTNQKKQRITCLTTAATLTATSLILITVISLIIWQLLP